MFSPKDPQKELEQAGNQATQEAVQSMTASLFTLLETVRTLDKERTQNGETKTNGATSKAKPIEITLGDEVVYQEDAHGAYANTLSLGEVDFLSNALKHSPGEGIDTNEPISIKVGDAQVFAAYNGVVTVNNLQQQHEVNKKHPAIEQLLTQGQLTNGNGVYTAHPPQVLSAPSPQPPTIQEPVTVHLQRGKEQPPSLLERVDTSSKLSPRGKHDPWMKVGVKARISQTVQDKLPKVRRGQVATTAVSLLQEYGSRQGKDFVFESEGYRFKGHGKTVTVYDHEGRELLFLETRVVGLPNVKGYYLTPNQEQDFLKARESIKNFGFEGISKDPLVRSRQLGSLAPSGDKKITHDLTGLAVVDVARNLLDISRSKTDAQGWRTLEGSRYRIEQSPQGLRIEAKGRGEILNVTDGKLTSNLTAQDVKHFIFVAKELGRELKQFQVATVAQVRAPKTSQMQR